MWTLRYVPLVSSALHLYAIFNCLLFKRPWKNANLGGKQASQGCHISTLQQISTYFHSKGNKEIVRVSGIRVYVVNDKVQVILYPLPGACCIKRSYGKRALKHWSGTTTKLFQINTKECHKLRCFMRPCPSFQLVVTRDTKEATEIRPCTSRPMAQKLSSRLKNNAIYYLGQNEIRTTNPSFFGNQRWSSAKAKRRHFPVFDRGGGAGKDSIFSIYFVRDCSLDATFYAASRCYSWCLV